MSDVTTELAMEASDKAMEIAQLKSDNAKLRELMRWAEQFEGMAEMWVERGVENYRLRELVRDMWHEGMCECDECGACAECEYGYLDRMRELGVEVDDGTE